MRAPAPKTPLMRDDVYERLRDDILSCALQPGTPVHEQALAQRFEVSKSPIRDALLRLQEQNLVDVLPRKGYRVRPISLSDAVEMYELRLMYERECALRAIEHASDAVLAALDDFRAGPRGRDMAKWLAYNRRFHLAIAAACGNARLARASAEIIEQFDRLTYAGVQSAGEATDMRQFAAEHGGIIEALQARDRRRTGALIRAHIEASRKRTLASIANPVIVP